MGWSCQLLFVCCFTIVVGSVFSLFVSRWVETKRNHQLVQIVIAMGVGLLFEFHFGSLYAATSNLGL